MIIRIAALLVLSMLAFSAPNFAQASGLKMSAEGPTMKELNVVRTKIGDFLHALKGVNGTGITACELKMGTPFYELTEAQLKRSEFVNCLEVTFDSHESKDAFDVLFPPVSAFQNVYLSAKYIGVISIEAQ